MKKNGLEWIVFALSSILVLATFGALFVDHQDDRGRPPILEVETATPLPQGEGWRVPFTVRNSGDTTAEAVKLEAEAGDQTASADLDYVPRGSERTGAFVFERRPEKVEARVAGYQDP